MNNKDSRQIGNTARSLGKRRLSTPWLYCLFILLGCGEPSQRPVSAAEPVTVITDVPEPERPGEDWPCFLGPQHTGVSGETGLLASWDVAGPPRVWERTVGTGYSAPAVLGNRLVMHHRIEDDEVIDCLQADTGDPLWRVKYPSDFNDPYGYNNGPRCSPVLTQDHCYTLGAEGQLYCVKLDSSETVWSRDLLAEYSVPVGFFGIGCSPLLEGDTLIVLIGGQPNAGVIGVDIATGKTKWEAVGKQTWDGAETGWSFEPKYEWQGDEMVVSYSSPVPATIHGQRHILCLVRQGLVSLDPATGQERFHYWFRPIVHESVNAAQPVVVDDTIMLSAAYKQGAALLKVHPSGTSYDVVWRDPRNLLTHWSTSIHTGGHYYGFSGRHESEGELRCLDPQDGRVLWKSSGSSLGVNDVDELPTGGARLSKTKATIPYPWYGRASKILVEGKFIILGERGGLLALVTPSGEGLQEVSRCTVKGMKYPSWTAPVLSRQRLYLRCEDALICLDLAASQAAQRH